MSADITIYGYGYVGRAVADFLKDHYTLQIYDPSREACARAVKEGLKAVNVWAKIKPTIYAVVCVPTAQRKDGSADIALIEKVVHESKHEYYLVKSTCPPGTVDKLAKEMKKKIAFSPEYIGEGKYEVHYWLDFPHPTNMKLHSFHIFGGERQVTSKWVEVWQKVGGWNPRYIQTTSRTAELVKYAENAFLATKKIFFDEIYEIARVLKVDYNELKELLLLDGRIGRSMTLIYPDNRGFTGKCLPKDLNAIVKRSEDAGYNPLFLKQVLVSNKKFRHD